jgi:large subunit ribosomal protein L5
MEQQTQNVMKQIRLDKVVLNMGVGRSGPAIEAARKALDQISGKKPCSRDAKEAQRDFGVRKGEPIGVAVTIRGEDADILLRRLLKAKGNTVRAKSFDSFGNFSFGIAEHIDIPGVKYEPQIGILGLDVAVSLQRPGYSIRKRSRHKARVGKSHRISAQEASSFVAERFEVGIQ